MLNTYKVKGKTVGLEFLFKYHLNGCLKSFEIVEGELTDEQIVWLFDAKKFPSREMYMQQWISQKSFNEKFNVETVPADISFEAAWKLYGKKDQKIFAEKCYNKLNEIDKVKLFIHIPKYLKRLAKSTVAQANFSTYINRRYFEDEY